MIDDLIPDDPMPDDCQFEVPWDDWNRWAWEAEMAAAADGEG